MPINERRISFLRAISASSMSNSCSPRSDPSFSRRPSWIPSGTTVSPSRSSESKPTHLTTHVQLVESAQSDIAREVLVHALLDPSSIGSRLKAMTYAADAAEPKVVQALILALRHDDNLAVRLEALALLTDHLDAPEVESAVLATLRDDESVQMRLLALDSLAGHSVDRERIRQVIETVERPDDAALLVRLTEYDKRL